MPEFVIRAAVPGDLDGVYEVFGLVERMHRNAHPEIFQAAVSPADIADIKDYFLSCILSEDAVMFVAENRGEIIGLVIAWIRQTPDNPLLIQRKYLSVSDLVVAEAFRQQGVGRALMKHINSWACERGLKQIELAVWDFNRGARAFYQKLGYEMLHHRMRKELT